MDKHFSTQDAVISQIDAFLQATKLSPSELGKQAVNNHRAVFRIREGKATLSTVTRIEKFMENFDAA